MCVDLREANKAVVIGSYPFPHVEELLSVLHGAKCFPQLNLESAYHQVTLHFGLASAPAEFQQMMATVLEGFHGVLIYIDNWCVFDIAELGFVCHHASGEGIAPLKRKVHVINAAPLPTKSKEQQGRSKDRRRGARTPKFKVGQLVRLNRPGSIWKGSAAFNSFCFEQCNL